MRKEYEQELQELKTKMLQAEAFATKLPMFAERILQNKITGFEDYVNLAESYKGLYFGWGARRGLFDSNTNRYVSNYPKDKKYKEYLTNIYINCYSLFNETHVDLGLHNVAKKLDLFFYDSLNSTFYATDEQLPALMEALAEWYKSAVEAMAIWKANKKIENAKKEIAEAEQLLAKEK